MTEILQITGVSNVASYKTLGEQIIGELQGKEIFLQEPYFWNKDSKLPNFELPFFLHLQIMMKHVWNFSLQQSWANTLPFN